MQPLMTAPETDKQAGKPTGRQEFPQGQASGLWSDAPGFRRLVLSAALASVVATSVQLVPSPTPEASQQPPLATAPLPTPLPPPAPQPSAATVVGPVATPPPTQVAEPIQSTQTQQKPQEPPAASAKPVALPEKTAAANSAPPRSAIPRAIPAPAHPQRPQPLPAPVPQSQEQTAMVTPAPQGRSQSTPMAPAPSQIPSRDCGPNARYDSVASAGGIVVGFLTPEQAQWLLQNTQSRRGMLINPEYLANKRAVVRIGRGSSGPQVVALVPFGMEVKVGDTVHFTGLHVDPLMVCHYVPNVIDDHF